MAQASAAKNVAQVPSATPLKPTPPASNSQLTVFNTQATVIQAAKMLIGSTTKAVSMGFIFSASCRVENALSSTAYIRNISTTVTKVMPNHAATNSQVALSPIAAAVHPPRRRRRALAQLAGRAW